MAKLTRSTGSRPRAQIESRSRWHFIRYFDNDGRVYRVWRTLGTRTQVEERARGNRKNANFWTIEQEVSHGP